MRRTGDAEKTYFQVIRPEKIRLGLAYVDGHTILDDVRILLRTARAAFETEKSYRGSAV